jgi:hypothetical protein
MAVTQTSKFSFSIDGVKYKDIKGYDGVDTIRIRVAGTAQMVRQWIKAKYSNIPLSGYFWINSSSFANGNSITVYLNDAPQEIFDFLRVELEQKFEYGSYHYGATQISKIKPKTDEGGKIDYGTKYLSVYNYAPSDANADPVDWSVVTSEPKAKTKSFTPKSSYSSGKTFDRGELLKDCAGWEINKKVYADGKILYTANKKPDTPKNKADWNLIKGEILTETGFSYSKYGNFQKFGQIASEAFVIQRLCEILTKYYYAPQSLTAKTNQISDELASVASWLIYGDVKNFEGIGLTVSKEQIFNPSPFFEEKQRKYATSWIEFLTRNETQERLKDVTEKEFIEIGKYVKDAGYPYINNVLGLLGYFGASGVEVYKKRYVEFPTMYFNPSNFISFSLVKMAGLNESYKTLPPNPKLEFCAINRAEGSYSDDTFPIQFQSFTALTKFIADNIGEMPKAGEGYDKYFTSFKWKFEDFEESDRYDVGEDADNPYKYPNLWAYARLRSLCYHAWQGVISLPSLSKDDEYFANEIGKEGWELTSVQFMSLLSDVIALFPEDKLKFAYNSYKERFDRFTSVYPKLFKLFSDVTNATKSKEDIQKAIKGLQYLADKGNDKAIKAIKGLQYLLNK